MFWNLFSRTTHSLIPSTKPNVKQAEEKMKYNRGHNVFESYFI